MPLTDVTVHAVQCDACPEVFDDEEGGGLFATVADANTTVRAFGWTVIGDQYLCTVRDDAHQELIDQAMPPEPTFQAPGQLALDSAGPVRPDEEPTT